MLEVSVKRHKILQVRQICQDNGSSADTKNASRRCREAVALEGLRTAIMDDLASRNSNERHDSESQSTASDPKGRRHPESNRRFRTPCGTGERNNFRNLKSRRPVPLP